MINYLELFLKFREKLASDVDIKTPEITQKIKDFFINEFREYIVLPTVGEKEFLVDIFVATKNPRQLSNTAGQVGFKAILAVESELGGEGGGSQGCLQKNVIEDFAKLLVITTEFKVMIFTSLPYSNENNHVEKRVAEIDGIYKNAGSPGNILLVHLSSEAQKTANNNPTNPKVSLKSEGMSCFLLSGGMSYQKLA